MSAQHEIRGNRERRVDERKKLHSPATSAHETKTEKLHKSDWSDSVCGVGICFPSNGTCQQFEVYNKSIHKNLEYAILPLVTRGIITDGVMHDSWNRSSSCLAVFAR